jgi:tetratricopeptide (TPR) repeat protein
MGAREVLQSWKQIAAYLGRDVRTCRRWEEDLGLPIHRLDGSPKARVMAYKDEVDWWLEAKLHEHDAAPPPRSPSASITIFGFHVPSSFASFRRWYVLVAFTTVLAVGVLGWRAVNNGRPHFVPNGSRPAVAVLPFVNGTGDEGLNYLRESLPDHLVRDLQRSSEHLRVFSFEAVAEAVRRLGLEPGAPLTPDDLAAVSDRLGAGWLLVGYFARSGSKLRIDYEVRETRAPTPLQTDHVPGSEADIAVLESRVANGVRRAFDVPTSAGPEAFASCSVLATRLYEAARAICRVYTVTQQPALLEKIIALFNQAREADPGCPMAYLGLGDALQYRFVYEDASPEVLGRMEESYRRAYAMAPNRAETNVGMAWVHYFKRDNDQSYAFLRKALALDPSSLHVLTDVGAFFRSLGMLERAAEYFTRVIQAGGTTGDLYLLRAYSYEQLGLFESALADYDELIKFEPTDSGARGNRARVLILMKRYDAAAAELAMAETLSPDDPFVGLVEGLAAAARGDRMAALAAIEAARDSERPTRGTYYRSRIYAALGMLDEAVSTIRSGIDRGFDDVYDYLYFFPLLNNTRDYFYDRLRNDPRFAEILRLQELTYAENLEKYSGL